MEHPSLVKPVLISSVFAVCIGIVSLFIITLADRPRVVFCAVGQGNGTYIRLQGGFDILVDTGPSPTAMLSCLGKYMPLYDRTIEVVIVSHLQTDHMGGFAEIARRYRILYALLPPFQNAEAVRSTIQKLHIPTIRPYKNQLFSVNKQATITFLWPPVYPSNQYKKTDDNQFCIVVQFCYRNRCFLLPGDIPAQTLAGQVPFHIQYEVLELPHHGSKTGTSRQLLDKTRPRLAVISVGKNNPYGHPDADVLRLLRNLNIPYRRTDAEGDVAIDL